MMRNYSQAIPRLHDFASYATPPDGYYGVIVNSGASANTKGAWVEVVSATPHECDGIYFQILTNGAIGTWLVDIGIGAAGSEQVLVPNLLYCPNTNYCDKAYHLPVHVAPGQRISVRCQRYSTQAAIRVAISVYRGDNMSRAFMAADAYGVNTSTSAGTAITSGGTTLTFGSYAELSSSIPNAIDSLVLSLGYSANTLDICWYDIATGAAGSEQTIISGSLAVVDTFRQHITPDVFYFPVRVQAGTRLSMRLKSTTTNYTPAYAALYGFRM